MGRAHDKDVEHAGQPEERSSTNEPPGKVEVDARGHNVWRWKRDGNDSTSVVLKRLDNEDLALEPTRKVPIVPDSDAAAKRAAPKHAAPKSAAPKSAAPKGAAPKDRAAPKGAAAKAGDGGGFDPYNSR